MLTHKKLSVQHSHFFPIVFIPFQENSTAFQVISHLGFYFFTLCYTGLFRNFNQHTFLFYFFLSFFIQHTFLMELDIPPGPSLINSHLTLHMSPPVSQVCGGFPTKLRTLYYRMPTHPDLVTTLDKCHTTQLVFHFIFSQWTYVQRPDTQKGLK